MNKSEKGVKWNLKKDDLEDINTRSFVTILLQVITANLILSELRN